MIGVVVPVHNEEACLEACLLALRVAIAHPLLNGEPAMVVAVLDACDDASAAIAGRHPHVTCLTVAARNVGVARHTGAMHLLAADARWLAFTDADSRVAPDWLVAQLAEGTDAVCGLIEVDDWSEHSPAVAHRFDAHYRRVRGHRHIHGANFGVASHAYQRAGGFPPMRRARTWRWWNGWRRSAHRSPGVRRRAWSPARAPPAGYAAALPIFFVSCAPSRWDHSGRSDRPDEGCLWPSRKPLPDQAPCLSSDIAGTPSPGRILVRRS